MELEDIAHLQNADASTMNYWLFGFVLYGWQSGISICRAAIKRLIPAQITYSVNWWVYLEAWNTTIGIFVDIKWTIFEGESRLWHKTDNKCAPNYKCQSMSFAMAQWAKYRLNDNCLCFSWSQEEHNAFSQRQPVFASHPFTVVVNSWSVQTEGMITATSNYFNPVYIWHVTVALR